MGNGRQLTLSGYAAGFSAAHFFFFLSFSLLLAVGGPCTILSPQTGKVVKQGRGVEKFARMPRTDLLQRLFALFERYKYYQFQTLRQQTEQPEPYLREVLSSIAQMERKGTYAGYWALRPEYSASQASHQGARDRALEQQRAKQALDKPAGKGAEGAGEGGEGRGDHAGGDDDDEEDDEDDDDDGDSADDLE